MLLVRQNANGDVVETRSVDSLSDNVVDDKSNSRDSQEQRTDRSSFKTCQEGPSVSSVIHDISAFRDFFLSAFSDGYNNACTFSEGIQSCCGSGNKSSADKELASKERLPPISPVRSVGSHDAGLQSSPSQDSRRNTKRKKAIAVAVGFKYAEDHNGRPIVITPTGNKLVPFQRTNSRNPQPRSPPTVPRQSRPFPDTDFPAIPHYTPPSPPRKSTLLNARTIAAN